VVMALKDDTQGIEHDETRLIERFVKQESAPGRNLPRVGQLGSVNSMITCKSYDRCLRWYSMSVSLM